MRGFLEQGLCGLVAQKLAQTLRFQRVAFVHDALHGFFDRLMHRAEHRMDGRGNGRLRFGVGACHRADPRKRRIEAFDRVRAGGKGLQRLIDGLCGLVGGLLVGGRRRVVRAYGIEEFFDRVRKRRARRLPVGCGFGLCRRVAAAFALRLLFAAAARVLVAGLFRRIGRGARRCIVLFMRIVRLRRFSLGRAAVGIASLRRVLVVRVLRFAGSLGVLRRRASFSAALAATALLLRRFASVVARRLQGDMRPRVGFGLVGSARLAIAGGGRVHDAFVGHAA